MPHIPAGMAGLCLLETIAEAILDRKKGVHSSWLDPCRNMSSCPSPRPEPFNPVEKCQLQGGAMLVRCRLGEIWSMSAIVSFTEVTTNPYASSVRLISEPHRGQTSFWASAIFRNVK